MLEEMSWRIGLFQNQSYGHPERKKIVYGVAMAGKPPENKEVADAGELKPRDWRLIFGRAPPEEVWHAAARSDFLIFMETLRPCAHLIGDPAAGTMGIENPKVDPICFRLRLTLSALAFWWSPTSSAAFDTRIRTSRFASCPRTRISSSCSMITSASSTSTRTPPSGPKTWKGTRACVRTHALVPFQVFGPEGGVLVDVDEADVIIEQLLEILVLGHDANLEVRILVSKAADDVGDHQKARAERVRRSRKQIGSTFGFSIPIVPAAGSPMRCAHGRKVSMKMRKSERAAACQTSSGGARPKIRRQSRGLSSPASATSLFSGGLPAIATPYTIFLRSG